MPDLRRPSWARSRRDPPPAELIYLIAPAGHPNLGDEFIARTWLRYLAVHRPRARVVLDCHTPGQASILLGQAHPNVQYVDTVWRMIAGLETMPVTDAAEVVTAAVAEPGRMPLLLDGIELLARADSIHLVGGGYVNSLWPHHLSLIAAAVAVRRRNGASVFLTGQGLLPAGDADHLALLRSLLGEVSVVDVRDHDSADLLAGSPLRPRLDVTGDDAWLGVLGEGVYDTTSPVVNRRFMICVQTHLMSADASVVVDVDRDMVIDGLESRVADLAQRWGMTGENTAFVEAMPGDDGLLYRRFVDRMPGLELIPFTGVWHNGFPATADQMWVTTRFHAHLLAAARGASGVVITGRTDYYPIKHRSLLEQGSRWRIVDSADDAPHEDGGFPAPVVAELAAGKRALAAALYPRR
ncbi:polysaccharide pyruvyl transferase family protein [Williamsia sp.]|uniref:polysaccharide pyruvyl transferase family protein n=1 Tax=Williamsia sp. TaxID=1872085 RepID=UPI001A207321|nr:polysaccharide pyruvyl transferase family protein [Williamsia sp.]MBJ7290225.1 polysaccharide pyruvyl transferase family protein [Williamsia sp.]